MRVKMNPSAADFGDEESGIKRVCEAYEKYGPRFGIEYVKDDSYQLSAIHAGIMSKIDKTRPIVAHIHGYYWTADFDSETWEYRANAKVIASSRLAEIITVPSEWVAETLRRDMHIDPLVVPHGIDWQDWQADVPNEGYVLWNKNRFMDVCTPQDINPVAKNHPDIEFYCTYVPPEPENNIFEMGLVAHDQMKGIVQRAAVYMSTAKETFSIGNLEALASGVPVLGYNHGGNTIMVRHGVNGYLAKVGDVDDLSRGLDYCLAYRDVLSRNAREIAKGFTWEFAVERVASAYSRALEMWEDRRRPHVISEELYKRDRVSA